MLNHISLHCHYPAIHLQPFCMQMSPLRRACQVIDSTHLQGVRYDFYKDAAIARGSWKMTWNGSAALRMPTAS